MRLRMAEKPSLEEFVAYLLSDLQYYCSYDDWIMQAQILMHVEKSLQKLHGQSLKRLAQLVLHGLSDYFKFDDHALAQSIGISIVYIIETFLMVLGRNVMLGVSGKGLRADFEDVLINHINCQCANLDKC